MTIKEFEDAIAIILAAIADAMEANDPMAVRSLLEKAPEHGYDRFLQQYSPYDLFTEERILRKVIITELDAQMGRPATKDEAAALHELLDIMSEFALAALYRKRTEEAREAAQRAARSERLAALGTLALGVGHDLANLLLPLRLRLDTLHNVPLPESVRDNLNAMERITHGMKDLSINLRALAADPERQAHRRETLDLSAWCPDFQKFIEPVITGQFTITCDVPENLPPAPISRAALSQTMFNLVHNAAKALRDQPDGRIILSARARRDGGLRIIVADNGPGMTPEVLKHCFEPFYTTRVRGKNPGTGLGLSLVHALLTRAGAHIEVHSPPPPEIATETARKPADGNKQGKHRGTAFIIDLPPHNRASNAASA